MNAFVFVFLILGVVAALAAVILAHTSGDAYDFLVALLVSVTCFAASFLAQVVGECLRWRRQQRPVPLLPPES